MSHEAACTQWLRALACYTSGSAPPLAPDSQAAFDALIPYLRQTVVFYDASAAGDVVEEYLRQRLPCAMGMHILTDTTKMREAFGFDAPLYRSMAAPPPMLGVFTRVPVQQAEHNVELSIYHMIAPDLCAYADGTPTADLRALIDTAGSDVNSDGPALRGGAQARRRVVPRLRGRARARLHEALGCARRRRRHHPGGVERQLQGEGARHGAFPDRLWRRGLCISGGRTGASASSRATARPRRMARCPACQRVVPLVLPRKRKPRGQHARRRVGVLNPDRPVRLAAIESMDVAVRGRRHATDAGRSAEGSALRKTTAAAAQDAFERGRVRRAAAAASAQDALKHERSHLGRAAAQDERVRLRSRERGRAAYEPPPQRRRIDDAADAVPHDTEEERGSRRAGESADGLRGGAPVEVVAHEQAAWPHERPIGSDLEEGLAELVRRIKVNDVRKQPQVVEHPRAEERRRDEWQHALGQVGGDHVEHPRVVERRVAVDLAHLL